MLFQRVRVSSTEWSPYSYFFTWKKIKTTASFLGSTIRKITSLMKSLAKDLILIWWTWEAISSSGKQFFFSGQKSGVKGFQRSEMETSPECPSWHQRGGWVWVSHIQCRELDQAEGCSRAARILLHLTGLTPRTEKVPPIPLHSRLTENRWLVFLS